MPKPSKKVEDPRKHVQHQKSIQYDILGQAQNKRENRRKVSLAASRMVKAKIRNPVGKRWMTKHQKDVMVDVCARFGKLRNGRIRIVSELHARGIPITRQNLDYYLLQDKWKKRIEQHRNALFSKPDVPISMRNYRLMKLQEILDGKMETVQWEDLSEAEQQRFRNEGIDEEHFKPFEKVMQPTVRQKIQAIKEAREEMKLSGGNGVRGFQDPADELADVPKEFRDRFNTRWKEILDVDAKVVEEDNKTKGEDKGELL